nr:immunoglobulin light chain junction region [Macaca mulatta]
DYYCQSYDTFLRGLLF